MIWAVFALGAATVAAIIPLLQEQHKLDSFTVAYWVKIVTVIVALPFVWQWGLPESPMFYALITVTAVLYAIGDLAFFRAAAEVGAGVLTRLLPGTVVGTFVLWFFVDPALLQKYLATPFISAGICVAVLAAAFFAAQLKQCDVSWRAVKIIWPLLLAATIGPLFSKPALAMAPQPQVVVGYLFVQAVIMLLLWSVYGGLYRRQSLRLIATPAAAKIGVMIGVASAMCVTLKSYAYIYADNPAYANILLFADSLLVLLFYRLVGRKETSNVWAGLGLVVSAVALVVIKSL